MKKIVLLMLVAFMGVSSAMAQAFFDPKASQKEVEKTRQSAVTPTYKKAGQVTEIRECCKKNEACCNPAQRCCDPIVVDVPQKEIQQNCETPANCTDQQNCGQENCTTTQNCNQQPCNQPANCNQQPCNQPANCNQQPCNQPENCGETQNNK